MGSAVAFDGVEDRVVEIVDVGLRYFPFFPDGDLAYRVHHGRNVDGVGAVGAACVAAHAKPGTRCCQGFLSETCLDHADDGMGFHVHDMLELASTGAGHAAETTGQRCLGHGHHFFREIRITCFHRF